MKNNKTNICYPVSYIIISSYPVGFRVPETKIVRTYNSVAMYRSMTFDYRIKNA